MIREIENIGKQYKLCADTILDQLEVILEKEKICDYNRNEEKKILTFRAGGCCFTASAFPTAAQIMMEMILVNQIPQNISATAAWLVRRKNQKKQTERGVELNYLIQRKSDKDVRELVLRGKINCGPDLEKSFYQMLLYMIRASREDTEDFQNIAYGIASKNLIEAIKGEYDDYVREWERGTLYEERKKETGVIGV